MSTGTAGTAGRPPADDVGPLRRTEVDGVPVVWRATPGPLSAGLVLGVGRRDEELARAGTTHLLEHLVMHEARSRVLSTNACVELATTEFTATGRPDRVRDFLRKVCELLADPPVERLALEASVLLAEAREKGGPALLGTVHGERYGNRGAGGTAVPDPAVRSITAEDVRAWAARWAVRGNAALWLTGPVPDGLSLPLPGGGAPVVDRSEQVLGDFPAWAAFEGAPVAVSAVVPHGTAGDLAVVVLEDRLMEELRYRRGLTYDVDVAWDRVSETERHVLVSFEVEEGQEHGAVTVLRDVLGELAAHGPRPEELAEHVDAWCGEPDDDVERLDALGEVQHAAECLVLGWSSATADRRDAEARALRPQDVRDVCRAVERTALVVVPEGVELDVRGLPRRPGWSPEQVTGRVFRPRWWKGTPVRARLVVGDEGVMLDLGGDRRTTVRWDDALALVEDDSEGFTHRLVGARGFFVPLDAGDWLGGRAALRLVQQRVPAGRQVRADVHSERRRDG
ncbi:hypothetical protein WDZ17_01260 [Pseudokineococcus basanitobsidens]|uniref:Zn-dependent peptidase n=1 Tax=Pseudokineococcus basanitobsidens TaxID=1926649 RepID=A0ABU8RFW6_9ACTN